MTIAGRWKITAVLLVSAAALAAAAWLGLPWIQEIRADAGLEKANNSIAEADALLGGLDLDTLGFENFVSIEAITASRDSLSASLPVIDQASAEIAAAGDAVDDAAGMALLSTGHRDYLKLKSDIAGKRLSQNETLKQLVERELELYRDGDVIFNALLDMDRLFGQFQANMAMQQTDPATAAADLKQTAESMRQVQSKLQARHEETGFVLLQSMSESVAENAALADLAGSLAEAAGSGDQARAQAAAISLQDQLLKTTYTRGAFEAWWQVEIRPLEERFLDLQEELEQLDLEAADIFRQRDES